MSASSQSVSRHLMSTNVLQFHCALPTFTSTPSVLTFAPTDSRLLFLAFPDNNIQVFDVESKGFPSSFAPVLRRLSDGLSTFQDSIMGLVWTPRLGRGHEKLEAYAWAPNWVAKLNFSSISETNDTSREGKRRRPVGQSHSSPKLESFNDNGIAFLRRFHHILLLDCFSDGELLVLERPLSDSLAGLPPAYFKQRYGT